MATRKGQYKKGEGGRPKGATNLITRTVKETVLTVFNELQGEPKVNLKAFAKKYPRDFYNIASRLIPTELQANFNKVEIIVRRKTDTTGLRPTTPGAGTGNEPKETV